MEEHKTRGKEEDPNINFTWIFLENLLNSCIIWSPFLQALTNIACAVCKFGFWFKINIEFEFLILLDLKIIKIRL